MRPSTQLVRGIAALNSQLASMEATLQYIAVEIHELVNHFNLCRDRGGLCLYHAEALRLG